MLIRVTRPSHISYMLEIPDHQCRYRYLASYPAYQKQQAVETGGAPEMEQSVNQPHANAVTDSSHASQYGWLHRPLRFHAHSDILAIIVATGCVVSH